MTIIPIKLGDAPIPPRVVWRSREPVMAAQGWPQEDRDDVVMRLMQDATDPKAQAAMAALVVFNADLIETLKRNEFNHQLVTYRAAATRLDRYKTWEGLPEVWEERETGEYIDGEPVYESIMVQQGIEPLPGQIEVPVFDEETGEQTGTEMVDNPAIEQDIAERNAAQAVIDQTPEAVIAFDAGPE